MVLMLEVVLGMREGLRSLALHIPAERHMWVALVVVDVVVQMWLLQMTVCHHPMGPALPSSSLELQVVDAWL